MAPPAAIWPENDQEKHLLQSRVLELLRKSELSKKILFLKSYAIL